ncbi:MAG TPA: NADH-quinone oxidoreductase subunit J [Planctomycetota bacterium]|nr:NADH-quinone oxidoreductase subunit J [Planctomycetota bacterium]
MSGVLSRTQALVVAASLAAAIVVGACIAGTEGAAFGFFALLAVGGGAACLFERSHFRAVAALCATFVGTTGLFLLLASDLLAVTQLLIAAGGIGSLFFFGARSLPREASGPDFLRVTLTLATIVPICAFAAWRCARSASFQSAGPVEAPLAGDAGKIGVALVDPRQFAVGFELAAVLLVVALVAALVFARRTDEEAS